MKLALVLEATAKMEGIKKANKDLKDLRVQVLKLQPLLNITKKALISTMTNAGLSASKT